MAKLRGVHIPYSLHMGMHTYTYSLKTIRIILAFEHNQSKFTNRSENESSTWNISSEMSFLLAESAWPYSSQRQYNSNANKVEQHFINEIIQDSNRQGDMFDN